MLTGQSILEQEINTSNQQIILDLKEEPGLYFVSIRTGNYLLVSKLVIN